MINPIYVEYQTFINGYEHPEFTSEKLHSHHIIPSCCGGTDEPSNLISLTVSAHQKAHEILARLATPEFKRKLSYAYREFTKTYGTNTTRVNLPSFGMLGNTERRTKVESIDMHTILQNASKNASWFFWTLIKLRSPSTNLAVFTPDAPAEAKKVTKAYQELNKANVLKRVRRGVYIINPKAYIPADQQFDVVLQEWNKL